MKWMIASDIHGSAGCCRKLIQAFHEEKADKLLLLGDILYHGPRNPLPDDYDPQSVARMLNEIQNRIISVQGNCDSEVDQMMLQFDLQIPKSFLAWSGKVIHVMHGHHLPEQAANIPEGDWILYGHTHVPDWKLDSQNRRWLNPGSVSLPKQDSCRSYMILEDDLVIWKTLEQSPYHHEKLIPVTDMKKADVKIK